MKLKTHKCKHYGKGTRVTMHNCEQRIRNIKSTWNRPLLNQMVDYGAECMECNIGKKIIKSLNIEFYEKIHRCTQCGRTESDGAEFSQRFHAKNGKRYVCRDCVAVKYAEGADERYYRRAMNY